MDNAIGVRCLNGPRQHLDKLCRQTRRLWRAVEVLGQVAASHVLQDEIRPARNFAHIVNLNNIRVLQSGDDIGLSTKAGKFFLAGASQILEHLKATMRCSAS